METLLKSWQEKRAWGDLTVQQGLCWCWVQVKMAQSHFNAIESRVPHEIALWSKLLETIVLDSAVPYPWVIRVHNLFTYWQLKDTVVLSLKISLTLKMSTSAFSLLFQMLSPQMAWTLRNFQQCMSFRICIPCTRLGSKSSFEVISMGMLLLFKN